MSSTRSSPAPNKSRRSSAAPRTGRSSWSTCSSSRSKPNIPTAATRDLTGREAYARYGAAVQACLAAVGGKSLYAGAVTDLMLGEVEELWDMVALAQYPSRAAMMAMVQSPEYQAIEKHRIAGLAGQLNIRTKAIGA